MHLSKPWPWAAALLGFCLFLYCWGLGRIPFYTKGEPREAVQVWEEIHAGEWILPLRNGHDLPSKPPLFHWLGGLTALATGRVNEFSVRFPSAALATASVLLTFWLATRKWGTTAGVFAGFMLATNFEWVRAATTARVDMTLTAFLIGAFVAFERIATATSPKTPALVAFYLCMGLAALGKGPVGLLLPGLVGFVYLALRRDLGRLSSLHLVVGGGAALAIAASWYVLAIAHGGEAFVYKQLFVENFGRFFAAGASGAGHVHPWYYLVGGFFTGFAPWSFFVVPLGLHLWENRRRLETLGYLYPLVWFATVFVFYSISQSKRTVYLLPIYPAAAMLLGRWWSGVVEDRVRMPAGVAASLRFASLVLVAVVSVLALILVATGFGAEPLALLKPLLHPKDQANLPLFQDLVRSRFVIFLAWAAALLPLMGLLARSVQRSHWGVVFAAVVAFVASTLAVVNGVLQPELAHWRSFKPFMAIVRNVLRSEDELAFYRTFDYGAVFYSHRHIRPRSRDFGPPSDGAQRRYVLLWESEWEKITDTDRERLHYLLKSEGTGPKGRDRLVFALVKPVAAETPALPPAETAAPPSPAADPTPPAPPDQKG